MENCYQNSSWGKCLIKSRNNESYSFIYNLSIFQAKFCPYHTYSFKTYLHFSNCHYCWWWRPFTTYKHAKMWQSQWVIFVFIWSTKMYLFLKRKYVWQHYHLSIVVMFENWSVILPMGTKCAPLSADLFLILLWILVDG